MKDYHEMYDSVMKRAGDERRKRAALKKKALEIGVPVFAALVLSVSGILLRRNLVDPGQNTPGSPQTIVSDASEYTAGPSPLYPKQDDPSFGGEPRHSSREGAQSGSISPSEAPGVPSDPRESTTAETIAATEDPNDTPTGRSETGMPDGTVSHTDAEGGGSFADTVSNESMAEAGTEPDPFYNITNNITDTTVYYAGLSADYSENTGTYYLAQYTLTVVPEDDKEKLYVVASVLDKREDRSASQDEAFVLNSYYSTLFIRDAASAVSSDLNLFDPEKPVDILPVILYNQSGMDQPAEAFVQALSTPMVNLNVQTSMQLELDVTVIEREE